MPETQSLVSAATRIVRRNKRYVVWFYLMNLLFAWWGATAFAIHAHSMLDNSLYADRLVRGFDLAVLLEMLGRPEFGPMRASTVPAMVFAVVFFVASLLFMPGVLLGYASDHRIPGEEFYRACGRNLWRFVRLFLFFAIVAGVVVGILGAAEGALVEAADKTSYERLPFLTDVISLAIIGLLLTLGRIWFDIAQTDAVLRDQPAARKSLLSGFRLLRGNVGRLLGAYIVMAVVALFVLAAGVYLWHVMVPSSSVFGAFLVSQATVLLLLTTRFWQRAAAVSFYLRKLAEPSGESATGT